jgi:prophage regulatory protein
MDDRERYYSYREVCELTTLSRTTIWRLRRKNLFPAAVRLSDGRIAWRARDVIAWCRLRGVWAHKADAD